MLSTRGADLLRLQLMAARYKERVGERIREARDAKGMTQAQLARLLPGSTDGSQVSRWERGEVQPQPDTLEALAAALEVDASYFLAPAPRGTTGDLLGAIGDGSQLDRIEELVSTMRAERDETAREVKELLARQSEVLATIENLLLSLPEAEQFRQVLAATRGEAPPAQPESASRAEVSSATRKRRRAAG